MFEENGVFCAGNTPESASWITAVLLIEYMMACRTARSFVGNVLALIGAKMPIPEIGSASSL